MFGISDGDTGVGVCIPYQRPWVSVLLPVLLRLPGAGGRGCDDSSTSSLPPHWRSRLSYQLLAAYWPSPGHRRDLASEPANRSHFIYISICLSCSLSIFI